MEICHALVWTPTRYQLLISWHLGVASRPKSLNGLFWALLSLSSPEKMSSLLNPPTQQNMHFRPAPYYIYLWKIINCILIWHFGESRRFNLVRDNILREILHKRASFGLNPRSWIIPSGAPAKFKGPRNAYIPVPRWMRLVPNFIVKRLSTSIPESSAVCRQATELIKASNSGGNNGGFTLPKKLFSKGLQNRVFLSNEIKRL